MQGAVRSSYIRSLYRVWYTLNQQELLEDFSSQACRTVNAAVAYNTGYKSESIQDKQCYRFAKLLIL